MSCLVAQGSGKGSDVTCSSGGRDGVDIALYAPGRQPRS